VTPLEVTVPPLHRGQLEVAQHSARFKVISCGRRWGKSRLAATLTVLEGLQGRRAWWISPSFPMAGAAWRDLKELASQAGAEIRESEMTLTFPRGGFVKVKSSDRPNTLRGEGLDFVVIDEGAFQSEAVFSEELRPALADRRGRALIASTPNGRNWFYRAFLRGQDPAETDWQSWTFPTSANPFIQPAEIEAAKRDMTERRYAQEFLAIPTEDSGAVFRGVLEAATATPLDVPLQGQAYVAGVDWGKSDDSTVITVLDKASGGMVAIDRFSRIDYTVQVGRLKALCDRFRPSIIVVERNSIGDPLIEQLQRLGLPVEAFNTTNASKATIIDALTLAFEKREIRILPDPVLLGELQAFEMERLPSGLMRYAAPEGLHDDTVMSLALAWYARGGRRGSNAGWLGLAEAHNKAKAEREKSANSDTPLPNVGPLAEPRPITPAEIYFATYGGRHGGPSAQLLAQFKGVPR
jgi:Terminase large subunit, T4likevirus-type, N-terminal